MDPRRLLTFREVARQVLVLARRPRRCALTQPAVSQQVAALERQLGVRLLDRGPAARRPTEAGALLLAHADAVADRLRAGRRAGRRAGATERDARCASAAFPSALATVVPGRDRGPPRRSEPDVAVEASEGSGERARRRAASGAPARRRCASRTRPRRRASGPTAPSGTSSGVEAMLAAVGARPPARRARAGSSSRELADDDVDGAVAPTT